MTASVAKRPVALSMGDPAGIGAEIIVKAASRNDFGVPLVVYGLPEVIIGAARQFAPEMPTLEVRSPSEASALDTLYLIQASEEGPAPELGKVSAHAGRLAFEAIEAAARDAQAGEVAALVTAPIHKESLAAARLPYPGHTEMLAELTGAGRVAMMLTNDRLRVVLVTVHCSLQQAIQRATFEAQLSAIRLAWQGMKLLGIPRPRIAVAGMNPHAGEGGLFGREEIEVIAPAIRQSVEEGLDVSGPLAGDTVFMLARQGRYDVVVAQYHDQGLIPIKYLGLERGVNTTLGLPFIRTSPDHGTAFDIAGKGRASSESLTAALALAIELSGNTAGIAS